MLINYYDEDNHSKKNVQSKLTQVSTDKKELEKQIELVQSRLNMLSQEDEQQERKIKNRKYKIKKILDVYNYKQELEDKKTMFLNKKNIKQQELQEKAISNRLNQTRILDEIREMMMKQKQVEKHKIQLQTQINEEDIRNKKMELVYHKKMRANKVKEHINRNQININNYWDNRLQSYSQDKMEKIQFCEQQKNIKANILQKLLETENNNLQKLQNSQENLSRLENLLNQSISLRKQKTDQNGRFISQRLLDPID